MDMNQKLNSFNNKKVEVISHNLPQPELLSQEGEESKVRKIFPSSMTLLTPLEMLLSELQELQLIQDTVLMKCRWDRQGRLLLQSCTSQ